MKIIKSCPICGEDNKCKAGQGPCWCFDKEIDKSLLELIPSEKRGKACVCENCVEKFKRGELSGNKRII